MSRSQSDSHNSRLGLPVLEDRAAFYFSQGLAASSVKTYQSGTNRFLKYCESKHYACVPVSEVVLCGFVSYLADDGLKHRTIKTYLSGVRYYQIKSGYHDPFEGTAMPRLEYVMNGIKRHQAKAGAATRTCLPITPSLLRQLREVWLPSSKSRDTKMIWAACCLCFFGFLRAGEMTVPGDNDYDPNTHLSLADIAVDDNKRPSLLRVNIKQSKTDPFRKGVGIFVGRTGTDLCPVGAILDYLRVRGSSPGALFIFSDGRFLTRQRFVDCVREGLQKAGVDHSKYSGHSFRVGAATTAASKGVEDCIQTLGRWKSLAYLQYVELPREQLSGYSALLAS